MMRQRQVLGILWLLPTFLDYWREVWSDFPVFDRSYFIATLLTSFSSPLSPRLEDTSRRCILYKFLQPAAAQSPLLTTSSPDQWGKSPTPTSWFPDQGTLWGCMHKALQMLHRRNFFPAEHFKASVCSSLPRSSKNSGQNSSSTKQLVPGLRKRQEALPYFSSRLVQEWGEQQWKASSPDQSYCSPPLLDQTSRVVYKCTSYKTEVCSSRSPWDCSLCDVWPLAVQKLDRLDLNKPRVTTCLVWQGERRVVCQMYTL